MNNIINRKLISAYARLLKKEVEHISVSMLCEKADVSRASFYIYHKDMSDFISKLHGHIIDLFFRQATEFLRCNNNEIKNAVKKENLLLNEDELVILSNMISGTNYFDFAYSADIYYKDLSLINKDIWGMHTDEIDIFSRGYLPILILDITDYNEKVLLDDIKKCRNFFKLMCGKYV